MEGCICLNKEGEHLRFLIQKINWCEMLHQEFFLPLLLPELESSFILDVVNTALPLKFCGAYHNIVD